jgi:uncharacterized protein with PIN domain
VTLIDAYGLVALIADEAAADEVEGLLRAGDCRVVAINLAEAVDICQRVHGINAEDVRTAIDPLILSGTLAVATSDDRVAWLAADLRVKHYDKKTCPLSMADCFLFAHAVAGDGALATADPDLAKAALADGVKVIGLPDRKGNRPTHE